MSNNLKPNKKGDPTKKFLYICTAVCLLIFIISFSTNINNSFIKPYSNVLFSPMKKGIVTITNSILNFRDLLTSKTKLISENKVLKKQIEDLNNENNVLRADQEELKDLRKQLEIIKDSKLEVIGAEVIGKDSDNWFNLITINKGSKDGIMLNMNVISNGGLVGIVTSVNLNSSVVRTIIDDLSATSSVIEGKKSLLIVEGNLNTIRSGYLIAKNMNINADIVVGDRVLTSSVSKKFLPDLLVGYVSALKKDEKGIINNIKITPANNFSYLRNVQVIKKLKEN